MLCCFLLVTELTRQIYYHASSSEIPSYIDGVQVEHPHKSSNLQVEFEIYTTDQVTSYGVDAATIVLLLCFPP